MTFDRVGFLMCIPWQDATMASQGTEDSARRLPAQIITPQEMALSEPHHNFILSEKRQKHSLTEAFFLQPKYVLNLLFRLASYTRPACHHSHRQVRQTRSSSEVTSTARSGMADYQPNLPANQR